MTLHHPPWHPTATRSLRRPTAENGSRTLGPGLHRLSGAEGEGFEPPEDRKALNGFQDRRIRPLCHPSGAALSLLSASAEPDRAGDAGAAEPAVAVRVLREVLLVVRLRVVERPGGRDLRRDLAEPGGVERRLVALARGLHGGALVV